MRFATGPGTVEWLLSLLRRTSRSSEASETSSLESNATSTSYCASEALFLTPGGVMALSAQSRQPLPYAGPPSPEDLDLLAIPTALDLTPSQPTPLGQPLTVIKSGSRSELELACCCLAAQVLGLLASREAIAREDASSRRAHPGPASKVDRQGNIRLAIELLRATGNLLGGNRGASTSEGVDTITDLKMTRRRLSATKEAAVACNAALEGLDVEALLEVGSGDEALLSLSMRTCC